MLTMPAMVALAALTLLTVSPAVPWGGDIPVSRGVPWGAGTMAFERLSLQQGLSQSIIEGILQDRRGFMWFVTEDGLNRYDGYRFTVYRSEAGNPNSLSHNELKTVFEDRSGMLWIGTFEGGLNSFDPATGVFTRYRHDPGNPGGLAANTVRCIAQDREGMLWLGTQGGGLDRFDPVTGQFVHFRHDPGDSGSLGDDDVRALAVDRSGVLWVGTAGGGLHRLSQDGATFLHYRHRRGDPRSLPHDSVHAIVEDSRGTLWVGTWGGGLARLDRGSGEFSRVMLTAGASGPEEKIKGLVEDHEGVLWVATDGHGLASLEPESGAVRVYRNDPADPSSLGSDRVLAVFQDQSRVLWLGTYGAGLGKLDLGRKRFGHVSHDPRNANSLGHDIVWSILEDRLGDLWVGTDSGGVTHFSRRSTQVRHLRYDPGDPHSLAHNTVRVIFEDGEGTLWLGTHGGGLDRYDRSSGRFTHFRHDPADRDTLAHDELRTMYEDRHGNLWIGTFGAGLDLLNRDSGRFEHFRHDPGDPGSLSNDFVRVVLEDARGTLWIGTQGGGLNFRDRAGSTFRSFRNDPDDPDSLSSDYVFALHEDRRGNLWVGTYGGGLNRLEPGSRRFTRFTEDSGLASNSVYGILEDRRGRLWISTNQGLSCFDPARGTFRNYDVRDGLQSNEFNGGAFFHSARGTMYFGGINGFNWFFPDEIASNPLAPPVVLTDVQLFNRSLRIGEMVAGRPVLTRPIEYTDRIVLSHRDDVVTLEFAALHYAAPEKNRYRYRLEGFSDAWIPAGADRRAATFTRLSPGEYVFRVQGASPDGVWNEKGVSLAVRVRPPYWATWWFRLILIGLGVAIGWILVRRHSHNIRLAAELRTAHDAQMAIMPRGDPDIPGLDISGTCVPAFEVGGDFFDWVRNNGDDVYIVVGDVSGKGMTSAMAAALSSGMVHSQVRAGATVEEMMTSVNRSLHGKVDRRMFTALCLAVVNPRTRELSWANAGLCEPLLKRGDRVEFLPSSAPSLPLGAFPTTRYRRQTLQAREHDVVVFYTDGVPEATDARGRQFGYEAMAALLARLPTAGLTARGIRDALVGEVIRFSAGARLSDDLSVVIVKVLGQRSGGDLKQ